MTSILNQNINSYKRKLILLVFGSLMLILMIYGLAIKKTMILRSEYKDLANQLSTVTNAPVQIENLKQKLVSIDGIIGANINDNYVLKEQILNHCGEYCNKNNLVIKDFPEIHSFSHENYQIETSKIVIQGEFIDVLKLIYMFENQYKIARVVSVNFHTEKNIRTKQKFLETDIYFQNVNILNNE